jgi:methenyltetrahydromethanopterin cyclohydrolase
MTLNLNHRALSLADRMAAEAEALGILVRRLPNGTRLLDCGIATAGGLEAGRLYAEVCLGGLGHVSFASLELGGEWLPGLTIYTDHPALACLASQYAGWAVQPEGYFALGSGPARALVQAEAELYADLDFAEQSEVAVLCLETRNPPGAEVAAFVAARAGVQPEALTLLVAPTASATGGVQVAARVVETALHKLHTLGFDVRQVSSGFGVCPLPPIAKNDAHAIGRTNDAVLYGGQSFYAVRATDEELADLVPKVPSCASHDYGTPFYDLFQRYGGDFYKIDPMLFSPAQVVFNNLNSGRTFTAGQLNTKLLYQSLIGE